jgi:hypothetical protein
MPISKTFTLDDIEFIGKQIEILVKVSDGEVRKLLREAANRLVMAKRAAKRPTPRL